MFSREALKQNWTDVRPFFIFSFILFCAALVVGGTPSGATGFVKDQVQRIFEMAQQTQHADHPQLTLFWVILKNNIIAAVMTMYLGIVAGLFPLFTMALNGLIIGFLCGQLADQGHAVVPFVMKGILPHGIFELPALFLAAGFGMLLGFSLIKGIFGSLFGKTDPWSKFTRSLAGSVPAAVLMIIVLLLAAVIESTVTVWLMS